MRKVSNNFRKLQKICIRYMSEGHHDHHSRMMPPFARLPPPDSKVNYFYYILFFKTKVYSRFLFIL
jgi:hypothetical protein